ERARGPRPGQALPDRHRGPARRLARHPRGRVLRPAGSQRGGEVDLHPLRHRPRPADVGQHPRLRPRRDRALRQGSPGGRPRAPGRQPRLLPHAGGDARLPRRLLRHAAQGAARAHRRAARRLLAVAQEERPHPDAVGRHEAPADPRPRADAPAAAADPRRADRGSRRRAAPGAVALRAPHQRRGHDDPAHHALPRRGRPALRPHRVHQRGPDRLAGQLAAARGRVRRGQPRGRLPGARRAQGALARAGRGGFGM
ncbi:MAG: Efflux ABC transporter, ATP-binding protein, partial [uncultured Solirubrobacteraceae bacterium]